MTTPSPSPPARPGEQPTFLSLFSGGGLADVGAVAAGYSLVGAVEYDPAIAGVYADNHGGEHLRVQGVETVDYRVWEGVHTLWASPPCPNFSQAKAGGEETEQDLALAGAVCRALREARPERFVLENVGPYQHSQSYAHVKRTLGELGYRWSASIVNMADLGVPQTRRRLILRASRVAPLRPLVPTHCEGGENGGLFGEAWGVPAWVGWYAAIEDLLPTLPESAFAPWQLARLPQALSSLLVDSAGYADEDGARVPVTRGSREPAATVVSNHAGRGLRAFLIGQDYHRPNTDPDRAPQIVAADAPALPVKASASNGRMRAFLTLGDLATPHGSPERPRAVSREEEPAAVVSASVLKRHPVALLVDGQNARTEEKGGLSTYADREPAPSVVAGMKGVPRALLCRPGNTGPEARGDAFRAESRPAATIDTAACSMRAWLDQGRVVAMTPRALARFQSCPDSYRLPENRTLACRVIGNGVPSLGAQRILESF